LGEKGEGLRGVASQKKNTGKGGFKRTWGEDFPDTHQGGASSTFSGLKKEGGLLGQGRREGSPWGGVSDPFLNVSGEKKRRRGGRGGGQSRGGGGGGCIGPHLAMFFSSAGQQGGI